MHTIGCPFFAFIQWMTLDSAEGMATAKKKKQNCQNPYFRLYLKATGEHGAKAIFFY